jgi:hypothetical protein
MTRRTLTIVMAGGLFAGLVAGQDAKPSGAQPGQILPGPFRALVVTNPDAPKLPESVLSEDRSNLGDLARVGKFHDFITRYGVDPTVAVFARELPQADQPLGKFLKALDQSVDNNRNARLHAFTIFLTLKGDFLQDSEQPVQIKRIQDFAEQLQLKRIPLGLDRAESERSRAFGIAPEATVVVLTYVKQTVQGRHVFTADKPLDDAGIQAVLGDVKKLVGTRN